MEEFSINHIFSTEKIVNFFYDDDRFVRFLIHWASEIFRKNHFDVSLYRLYYSTIELVGYPAHLGKFKPSMIIFKYIEDEPDEDVMDILEYIQSRVQNKAFGVLTNFDFLIFNSNFLEDYYISGHLMSKIGFEIFQDKTKKGYDSLALRKKWIGLP